MPFDMTEEEFARFREGDNHAFNIVIKEFWGPLIREAWRMIKNYSKDGEKEAEDIVAEAFRKLNAKRNNITTAPDIGKFLYRVVYNACLNCLINANRKKEVHKILLAHLPGSTVIEDKFLQGIHYHLEKLMRKEIEKLPERCRQIFKLYYIDEISIKEIARRMGITVSTVYNQKVKGRNLLQKALLKNKFFMANLFD